MFLGFGGGERGDEGRGGGVADGERGSGCFSTSHVTQHGQASKTALDAPWLWGFLVRQWRTRSRSSWGLPAAALFLSGSTGLRALLMGPQIEPCGSLTDSTEAIVTGAAGCVVEADASLLRVPSSARSARTAMWPKKNFEIHPAPCYRQNRALITQCNKPNTSRETREKLGANRLFSHLSTRWCFPFFVRGDIKLYRNPRFYQTKWRQHGLFYELTLSQRICTCLKWLPQLRSPCAWPETCVLTASGACRRKRDVCWPLQKSVRSCSRFCSVPFCQVGSGIIDHRSHDSWRSSLRHTRHPQWLEPTECEGRATEPKLIAGLWFGTIYHHDILVWPRTSEHEAHLRSGSLKMPSMELRRVSKKRWPSFAQRLGTYMLSVYGPLWKVKPGRNRGETSGKCGVGWCWTPSLRHANLASSNTHFKIHRAHVE